MAEFLPFLVEHGYIVVFAWVFLDQAGLPLPAVPVLIAAGVLVGMGQMELIPVILLIVLASAPIGLFWFWLGRVRGSRVLHLLCILSLEPDYCVRNTENIFRKMGPMSLVIGKFVPGLQTLAPPMSGLTGVSFFTFMLLNTLGTILWAGIFVGLGIYFHTEVEKIIRAAAEFGVIAGISLAGVIAAYFSYKVVVRQRFVRSLRMRRLKPHDVYERMKRGDDLHVIDLRHDYDVLALPHLLPNALRVPMEAIDQHANRIPQDSDILLCCN
jgi:membrane protein DedA with SNARE-associated domain